MKLILGACLGLLLAATASADSVWSYTGNSVNLYKMNPFAAQPPANPCACALNGTVLLTNAWTPTAWSFTAGNETFTNLNSTLNAYLGPVDPDPTYMWSFFFTGNDGAYMVTKFSGSFNDALDQGGGMSVGSHPGVWTEIVATPEPETGLLLAIGVALLAFKRRRKPADRTVWETLA